MRPRVCDALPQPGRVEALRVGLDLVAEPLLRALDRHGDGAERSVVEIGDGGVEREQQPRATNGLRRRVHAMILSFASPRVRPKASCAGLRPWLDHARGCACRYAARSRSIETCV